MSQRSVRYNSTCIRKVWIVGSLFIFCFVTSLAAQQTNDAQSEHYARGMHAIQLGLYDEAIDAFQHVLKLNPRNAEAYCELGAVYTFKEKTDDALAAYLQCTWNCPHLHRHTVLHTSVWRGFTIRKAGSQTLKTTGNTLPSCYRRTPKSFFVSPIHTYNAENWI